MKQFQVTLVLALSLSSMNLFAGQELWPKNLSQLPQSTLAVIQEKLGQKIESMNFYFEAYSSKGGAQAVVTYFRQELIVCNDGTFAQSEVFLDLSVDNDIVQGVQARLVPGCN